MRRVVWVNHVRWLVVLLLLVYIPYASNEWRSRGVGTRWSFKADLIWLSGRDSRV